MNFKVLLLPFLVIAMTPSFVFGSPLLMKPTANSSELSQQDARDVIQPIVNTTRYSFLLPAGHTGEGQIEIGTSVHYGATTQESQKIAKNVFVDGDKWPKATWQTRASVTFGLPNAFDVSLQGGWIAYSRLYSLGLGVQATLFDGPPPSPVVSFRAAGTLLKSFDKPIVDAALINVELLAGLHLAIVEPYIGFGGSHVENTSKLEFSTGKKSYKSSWNDVYLLVGGRSWLLPTLSTGAEIQFSELQWNFSLKLAWSPI